MTVRDYLLMEFAKASADYKKARERCGGSLYSSCLYEPSRRLDRLRTWIDTLPSEIMSAEIKRKEDENNDTCNPSE